MTYGDTAFCETLHRPQFETLKVLMCLSDHYNTSVQNCFQRMTASSWFCDTIGHATVIYDDDDVLVLCDMF